VSGTNPSIAAAAAASGGGLASDEINLKLPLHETSFVTIKALLDFLMTCYAVEMVMTQQLSLERFSYECRKVIGFAFTKPRDWFKKLAPLFHPIRSKTKTKRDSLVRVFPPFASATCNYFVF